MVVLDTYNESIGMILGGLTILASIAWRDVIGYYLDKIIAKDSTSDIVWKVAYAAIMTFIAVLALRYLKPKLTIQQQEVDELIQTLKVVQKIAPEQLDEVMEQAKKQV